MSIASPLLRAGRVDGTVALSSALRYDAAVRALRLEQPKAERLELQGVSGGDAERLQQIGGLVAQELLRHAPGQERTATTGCFVEPLQPILT